MRIVNPSFGIPESVRPATVARDGVAEDALCLFSNSKPNATELLRGVAERLSAERGFEHIGFGSKPAASVPAEAETLDRLSERYRMAIVAIGD
jgi:thioredoxin reductase (NADPH)